jgi:hypothetical protein
MRTIGAATLLSCCLAFSSAGAQDVRYYREGHYLVSEFTGAVPVGASRVRVEVDLGAVRVDAAPANEVRYRIVVKTRGDEMTARQRLDEYVVSASRDEDVLLFTGELMREDHGLGLRAEFAITVPESMPHIEVVTGAGEVVLGDLAGMATLVSHGGPITVTDIGGPLRAETRGGDIRIGDVASGARLITAAGNVHVDAVKGDLMARTSGGDVRIGRVAGGVEAETGGGSIWVDAATGDVSVGTSGGNIVLGKIGGQASAATIGGSIRVGSVAGGVKCETGSGPIILHAIDGPVHALTSAGSILADFVGSRGVLADADLLAWQGDVTISLPESLPVTIRALINNPLGAGILSEFPLDISREIEETGRLMMLGEGEIGGGGSVLRVRTLGGNIEILKARDSEE